MPTLKQIALAVTCAVLLIGPLCLASAALDGLFRKKGPEQ